MFVTQYWYALQMTWFAVCTITPLTSFVSFLWWCTWDNFNSLLWCYDIHYFCFLLQFRLRKIQWIVFKGSLPLTEWACPGRRISSSAGKSFYWRKEYSLCISYICMYLCILISVRTSIQWVWKLGLKAFLRGHLRVHWKTGCNHGYTYTYLGVRPTEFSGVYVCEYLQYIGFYC